MDEIMKALFRKSWAAERLRSGVKACAQCTEQGLAWFCLLGICHELRHNKHNSQRFQLVDALAAKAGWAPTIDLQL